MRFFHSSDAAGVAEHVLKLLSQQVNPHDITVLARTNSTLKDVSEKLKEYGIPSSREDFPIIETRAYTLASSLLRIVESSNDALAKATVAYLTEQDYNTRKIIEEKILLSCDYIYDTISIKEIWKIIRLLNDKIVSLHLQ